MPDKTVFTWEDLKNEITDDTEAYLPVLGQLGFISTGGAHILSSPPKAGKTELLLAAVAAWTDKSVLWFTEESKRTWKRRYDLRHQIVEGTMPQVEWDFALGKELVSPNYLKTKMLNSAHDVIIYDTIRGLLGISDENDNAIVALAMIPYIQAAAEMGKTTIFVHHDRKSSGEYVEAVSGASAFAGIVDSVLELRRMKGNNPFGKSGRTLEVLGRVDDIGSFTYARHDNGELYVVNTGPGISAELPSKIMDSLNSQWLTTGEVMRALPGQRPATQTLRKVLIEMAGDGSLERDPSIEELAQGKTVKWRKRSG